MGPIKCHGSIRACIDTHDIDQEIRPGDPEALFCYWHPSVIQNRLDGVPSLDLVEPKSILSEEHCVLPGFPGHSSITCKV